MFFHEWRRGVPNVHSKPMYSPAGARTAEPGRLSRSAHVIPPHLSSTPKRKRCTKIVPGTVPGGFFCGLTKSWIQSQKLRLLDVVLALEVLALDELRYLVIIVVLLLALSALLHALVALGKLAEGSERVGAELVEDTGDELGELLVLTVAVEGEGVGGDGGVNCGVVSFGGSSELGACL